MDNIILYILALAFALFMLSVSALLGHIIYKASKDIIKKDRIMIKAMMLTVIIPAFIVWNYSIVYLANAAANGAFSY